MTIKNDSLGNSADHWTDGEFTYREMCRQEYGGNNCVFSAGLIDGHPVDTIYLRWEKDGHEPAWLMLRPDEASAIIWVLSGTQWSQQLESLPSERGEGGRDGTS